MISYASVEYVVPKPENILLLCLLLFSAWVLADPRLNLTVDEELLDLNSSSILSEEDWRQEQGEENAWRTKPTSNPRNDARWSNRSIYAEDEKQLPGLNPEGDLFKGAIDDREAAPKLKFRF